MKKKCIILIGCLSIVTMFYLTNEVRAEETINKYKNTFLKLPDMETINTVNKTSSVMNLTNSVTEGDTELQNGLLQLRNTVSGLWGSVQWEFDPESGILTFVSGGTLSVDTNSPWNRIDELTIPATSIKKIVFTKNVSAPSSAAYLFSSRHTNFLTNLTTIENLTYLDTSKATNLYEMFYNASRLTELDVSNFDTSSATVMSRMFMGTSSLTELDVSNFDTSNVKLMVEMFSGMTSMTGLDLSSFNTSKVTDMTSLLDGNFNLKTLNIGNFNTNRSTVVMFNMFCNLDSLNSLTLGSKFRDIKKNSGLPKIPIADGYTGKWLHKETNTSVGSSSEFINNYDGSLSRTYVRELISWGNVPWEFDESSGTLTFTGTGSLGKYTESPWNRKDSFQIPNISIKKIVFTQKVEAPLTSEYLFSSGSNSGLVNLTTIENLEYLDTSKVNSMYAMFYGAKRLTELDVSKFDTSSVTNMEFMLSNMTSLTELDVSNFDTSSVTRMISMFSNNSVTSLDLSSFDTSNVTNMNEMFHNNTKLKSLNISSFNTTKVTSMNNMFYKLSSLNSLTLGVDFRNKSASTGLPEITIASGYTGKWLHKETNTSVGTSSEFINNYDGYLPGTYVWERTVWGDVPWEFDESSGTLTFLGSGTLATYKSSPWNRTDSLKISNEAIKKIIFTQKVEAPSICDYLFSINSTEGLTNLITIENLKYLDTSKVTTMYSMFYRAKSLTELDVSNFDTSNVKDMQFTFSNTSSLTELDVSNFDTSNVTNMNNMFSGMPSIKVLDLSSFDTSKVINMYAMFFDAQNLTDLNISTFDTSNVEDMAFMFSSTRSLVNFNVNSFNTSKVIDMNSMFSNMKAITNLDLSSFDTSSVTNMTRMFNSSNITTLNISSFNTNKANINYIFQNLYSLNSLTLGSDFKIESDVITGLPNITIANGYTGNWLYKETNTSVGTSSEFMNNYDGSQPGTYIWQTGKYARVLSLTSVPSTFRYSPIGINNVTTGEQLISEASTNLSRQKIGVSDDRIDKSAPWRLTATASKLISGSNSLKAEYQLNFGEVQNYDPFQYYPNFNEVDQPNNGNLTVWNENETNVSLTNTEGFSLTIPADGLTTVSIISATPSKTKDVPRYGVGLSILSNRLIIGDITEVTSAKKYNGEIIWTLSDGI